MVTNLITLEQYKQAKGLIGDKEDSKLNFLIPSISQLIKTYCNNTFNDYINQPYEEAFSIEYSGVDWIQLSQSPVLDVEYVGVRYKGYEAYELLNASEYVLDKKADILKRLEGSWPIGTESVEVHYLAGYEELPTDIFLAAVDLIAYYLKEEYRQSKTIQGTSQQTPAGTTMRQDIGFPDHIRRVLDMYRQLD